jgi:hypothetical protein
MEDQPGAEIAIACNSNEIVPEQFTIALNTPSMSVFPILVPARDQKRPPKTVFHFARVVLI